MESAASRLTQPVLLGIGSNLGDRLAYLQEAIRRIAQKGYLHGLVCSSVYESSPMGYLEQPNFLNCCIAGTTAFDPLTLHQHLKAIEREMGRQERPRWHPREIDIDIILYGDTILETDVLTLPHPRALERPFVLVPASEIVPEWVHPITRRNLATLAAELSSAMTMRKTEFCIHTVDTR